MSAIIEINDCFDELREQNEKLFKQNLFSKILCEDYRNFVKVYYKKHYNKENIIFKTRFDYLESQFKQIFGQNEDEDNEQISVKKTRSKQVNNKDLQTHSNNGLKNDNDNDDDDDNSTNEQTIGENSLGISNTANISIEDNVHSNTQQVTENSTEETSKRAVVVNKNKVKNPIKLKVNTNNVSNILSNKRKFHCRKNKCRFTTIDSEIFQIHRKSHLGEKPFKCHFDGCDKDYKQKYDLTTHINKVHLNLMPYKCDECSQTFHGKSYLRDHITAKHKDMKYKCDQCDYKSIRMSNLHKHKIALHSDERPFVCTFDGCDKKYSREGTLRLHMFKHTDRPLGCDWPGCEARFVTNRELEGHLRQHTGDRPFSCDQCDKSYASKPLLWAHKHANHQDKRFVCNHCDYRTNLNSQMIKHMRTHTGEKPFKCPVVGCDKYFSRKSSVLVHKVHVHDNLSLFICQWPDCGRALKSKSQLTIHHRTHTGEKPFACVWPGCEARFTSNKNLKAHRFTHTKERPFRCEGQDCDKTFVTQYEMRKHFNSNHNYDQ